MSSLSFFKALSFILLAFPIPSLCVPAISFHAVIAPRNDQYVIRHAQIDLVGQIHGNTYGEYNTLAIEVSGLAPGNLPIICNDGWWHDLGAEHNASYPEVPTKSTHKNRGKHPGP